MKTFRQLSMLALAGVFGLLAASCSKDNDDNTTVTPGGSVTVPTTKEEAINMLQGQWHPSNPAQMVKIVAYFTESDAKAYYDDFVADIMSNMIILGVHLSDKAPVEEYRVMVGNYSSDFDIDAAIIPDGTDVTKGVINIGGVLFICYENLNSNSVRVYTPDDFLVGEAGEDGADLSSFLKFDDIFTRVTTPVIMMPWSNADYFDSDNRLFYTQTSSTSCKVSGYDYVYYDKNIVKKITIPETVNINGRTCVVTAIGKHALNGIENLEEVVLPTGIAEIEDYAFSGDKKLEKLNFPEKLRTIGEFAFAETGFREIELNEGLETVGSKAFTGMMNEVQKLVLPSTLKTIGGSAFATINDHTMNNCHYRDVYSHILDVNSIDFPGRSDYMDIFEMSSIETLHVPVGTKSSYASHNQFMWTARKIVEDADL